jgi:hypothetical protein
VEMATGSCHEGAAQRRRRRRRLRHSALPPPPARGRAASRRGKQPRGKGSACWRAVNVSVNVKFFRIATPVLINKINGDLRGGRTHLQSTRVYICLLTFRTAIGSCMKSPPHGTTRALLATASKSTALELCEAAAVQSWRLTHPRQSRARTTPKIASLSPRMAAAFLVLVDDIVCIGSSWCRSRG